MKPISSYLLISLLSFPLGGAAAVHTAAAQSGGDAGRAPARATIEGIVIKDPGGDPVKKALIELIAENQAEGGDYTEVTAADGMFRIEGIVPGRYHLFAERTGLLEKQKHGAESPGRLLTLTAGQEVRDLQIRLQEAAVLHGRVTNEDGDPLPNAQVAVLRQNFVGGRSRWEQEGSERSNDLGEYRIANLAGGNYYVSVSPPPDFKSLIAAAGKATAASATAGKPALSYQPTYYPGTTDRSQASSLQLHAGDDFPLNFSLTPGPSLSIRGSVVNLPPHSSATIMLQSRDFNLVLNSAEMHKDGSFVIRDVAPGAYTIVASVDNMAVPMMARQAVQVASNSVEGLRIAPQTGGTIRGRLRLETRNAAKIDFSQIFLALHPTDGDDDDAFGMFLAGAAFNALSRVAPDGSFEWKGVPAGSYYVQLAAEGATSGVGAVDRGWYLKSAAAGGREVGESGINVSGGMIAVDLVASGDGALLEGMAVDSRGNPVANAVVVAVPEARLRKREDHYRKTISDQNGRFILRAIPPGDYTLFAWESLDGQSYYDPEFLNQSSGHAMTLHAMEGDHKTLRLEVIPEQEVRE